MWNAPNHDVAPLRSATRLNRRDDHMFIQLDCSLGCGFVVDFRLHGVQVGGAESLQAISHTGARDRGVDALSGDDAGVVEGTLSLSATITIPKPGSVLC